MVYHPLIKFIVNIIFVPLEVFRHGRSIHFACAPSGEYRYLLNRKAYGNETFGQDRVESVVGGKRLGCGQVHSRLKGHLRSNLKIVQKVDLRLRSPEVISRSQLKLVSP